MSSIYVIPSLILTESATLKACGFSRPMLIRDSRCLRTKFILTMNTQLRHRLDSSTYSIEPIIRFMKVGRNQQPLKILLPNHFEFIQCHLTMLKKIRFNNQPCDDMNNLYKDLLLSRLGLTISYVYYDCHAGSTVCVADWGPRGNSITFLRGVIMFRCVFAIDLVTRKSWSWSFRKNEYHDDLIIRVTHLNFMVISRKYQT